MLPLSFLIYSSTLLTLPTFHLSTQFNAHSIILMITPKVIEAEIRYAVKHEYALTAIDAISRRCRLSFLNAQAALDALPRVIEIMSEELGWDDEKRRKEMENAVGFLGSMGLSRGVQGGLTRTSMVSSGVASDPANSRGVWEWVGMKQSLFGSWKKRSSGSRYGYRGGDVVYSRAQFEPGEIEMLRKVFAEKADHDTPTSSFTLSSPPKQVLDPLEHLQSSRNMEAQRPRVDKGELFALVKGLPGYGGIKVKDFEYVLEEVGFASRSSVDFDEFVEVRVPLNHQLPVLLLLIAYANRFAPSYERCCSHRGYPRKSSQSDEGSLLRKAGVEFNVNAPL